jgi:hypothetical protein
MYWIDWIRGWLAPALDWFEAHPGIASWLQAVGSIGAIVFRLSVRPLSGASGKITRGY